MDIGRRTLLAWILLTFFGCKSASRFSVTPDEVIDSFRAAVRREIEDERRQREVIQIAGEMEAEIRGAVGEVARLSQEMTELTLEYDTTPEQLESVLASYRDRRARYFRRIVDHRLRMRELVSEDEWKGIAARLDMRFNLQEQQDQL